MTQRERKPEVRKWMMAVLALALVGAGWLNTWEEEPVSSVISTTRVEIAAQDEIRETQDPAQETTAPAKTPDSSPTAATAFEQYRMEMEETRQTAAELLNEVLSDERVQEETAQRALEEKRMLARRSETEKNVETLLQIRGFEESLCVVSEDSASIVVRSEQLSQKEAAQILDIAMEQTGLGAEKIRIIPTL